MLKDCSVFFYLTSNGGWKQFTITVTHSSPPTETVGYNTYRMFTVYSTVPYFLIFSRPFLARVRSCY